MQACRLSLLLSRHHATRHILQCATRILYAYTEHQCVLLPFDITRHMMSMYQVKQYQVFPKSYRQGWLLFPMRHNNHQ